MKTNHKNQLFAVLLALAVSVYTASCAAHKRGQPEVTALTIVQEPISMPTVPEVTAEPSEPKVMASVEATESSIPEETEQPAASPPVAATEPLTIEPPVIPTEPPEQEPQPGIPAEAVPPVTQPPAIPTEPPATEPPAVPTDPPATEPIGCQHIWQPVQHPEEGHYVGYAVCKCGYRCNGANDWFSHRDSFSLEDALAYHTSYGVGEDYIVDSPAYTIWVCTKCGAASDTQP